LVFPSAFVRGSLLFSNKINTDSEVDASILAERIMTTKEAAAEQAFRVQAFLACRLRSSNLKVVL
jgi:hypothetical protein